MQLSHENFASTPTDKDLVLLCDHIQSPANMGALFRICDAFGIKEILFHGINPNLNSSRLKSTARNTHKIVHFRESANALETLAQLHEQGYKSVALEITSQSIPLQTAKIIGDKIVLVIGNESVGVSDLLLDRVNHHVHIKMFGTNSSMNVAQATAVAFYELTRC